jgi:drug/metabolite transporter (DMT)-like permease
MKRGYVFVLLTALVSGFSIFINKFGVKGIDPYIFTFSKNVLVVLFLLSLIILFKEFKTFKTLTKNQWLKLGAIGLFGGSIPFLLFFKGLAMSPSTTSALLHKSMFIFVTILAVYFLKEKLSKGFIIGALLLFGGNFLLLKITSFSFGIAEALILCAVLLWAVETTISKHILKELPSKIVAFGRMCFGIIFIFIFLAATGNASNLALLSTKQLSWILLTAVLLLLYVTTWYAGLKRVQASSAACILVLGSAITTTLSFIYSSSYSFVDILGIIFILGGIASVMSYSYLASKIKIILPYKN